MNARIRPLVDIGGRLLSVERPSRYLGGEHGCVRKDGEGLLTIALCFPDLYEIGMSNNAIRILYCGLNELAGVRCERVFAPAPDFESLLLELDLPLYTLETGIPLHSADILGLSIGYELAATSILSVLELGRIPRSAVERGEGDPIVIAGGPAASNPHSLGDFLDAAYIGEGEATFFVLAADLAKLKAAGARRGDLLERISREDAVWMPKRDGTASKRAIRAIFDGFAANEGRFIFPLPTVKTVQEHGTVEIMRGCPNGCRFCHAGYYYRPQRSKPYRIIRSEVESLVRRGGYREITLASLSSGDYCGVGQILASLNAEWAPRRISFQLPSLKVNSFTLPLIKELSEVRKSGLTFAVETPFDEWQRIINKDVSFERSLAILREARSQGFRQAKFYFMIGLPVPGSGAGEAEAIVEFFERLFAKIDMQINVNLGTFVPKPHTPFQWSKQLSEEDALSAINTVRSGLRRFRSLKLSYHSPFVSVLEGILSRGDERVGELLVQAYRKGARLDAWEEHFDRGLWRSVLEEAPWRPFDSFCGEKDIYESLPWDDISIRVTKATFRSELKRAQSLESTVGCAENCTHPCGSCRDGAGIEAEYTPSETGRDLESASLRQNRSNEVVGRLVLRISKTGAAKYLQHLSVIDALSRAFLMTDLPSAFSEGFNPMPRLEMGQPLPIAIESQCEIATILLTENIDTAAFLLSTANRLPDGLRIEECMYYPVRAGIKQRSIGSLAWGSRFRIAAPATINTETLYQSLRLRLNSLDIGGSDISLAIDGKIILLLPEPKMKGKGLIRILEDFVPVRPVQSALDICREIFFAEIGGGPISFFSAYTALS